MKTPGRILKCILVDLILLAILTRTLALVLVVVLSMLVLLEGSTGVVVVLVAVRHAQLPRTLVVSDGRSCVTPLPLGQRRAQGLTASGRAC